MNNNWHIEVFAHGQSANFECTVCGGEYHQRNVAAGLFGPSATAEYGEDPVSYGDVCPDCLDAGPAAAAATFRRQAAEKRAAADFLEHAAADVAQIPATSWAFSSDLKRKYLKFLQAMHTLGAGEAEFGLRGASPVNDNDEIPF